MDKKKILGLLCGISMLCGCTTDVTTDAIDFSEGVRVSFIHTSDIHSRLLPYDMDVMATDERMGLLQANEPFGGVARAATAIRKIRDKSMHAFHVDSGDLFQGAPIFNEFNGDPEILFLNKVGIDGFVIGNHEFDNGMLNLYDKLSKAQFAVLAANYQWRPSQGNTREPLNNAARPYVVANSNGVRFGLIGMANYSSMSSITYGDNGLGITVLENVQTVQSYIDALKNDVNIVSMVTHLGLGQDEDVIRNTSGLDVAFGGHLHIVLNPPKIIEDHTVDPVTKEAAPKLVPLVHSGAFMKFLGNFEGVFYPHPERPWDLELRSHQYTVVPLDSSLKDDPQIQMLLDPYERELARRIDLRLVIGYAPQTLKRFGTAGKDSPLGNFLADSMVYRQRVEADFGATNSLGIRTDIIRGPVTSEQMYNVFPFPNSIATMTMSGNEVWALLDYNTYRSMNRGCQSQLQVSGVRYTLNCHAARKEVDDWLKRGKLFEFQYRDPNKHFAEDIKFVRGKCEQVSDCAFPEISTCEEINDTEKGRYKVCLEKMQPQFYYKFATNDYMAHGGSGFSTLRFNTTQSNTNVELREAAIDGIRQMDTCYDICVNRLKQRDSGFDESNPRIGRCEYMKNCEKDLGQYERRACKNEARWSPAFYCIEEEIASGRHSGADLQKLEQCITKENKNPYKDCLAKNYPTCLEQFEPDAVERCYESSDANENKCAAVKDTMSPFAQCVSEISECSGKDTESPYEKCSETANRRAKDLCMIIPCLNAGTDGRQYPIVPRNEDFIYDQNTISTNGSLIMQGLQDAGYDACH